jgi:hypothetical protein
MVGKERSDGIIVSTFHSLCVRILRKEIEHPVQAQFQHLFVIGLRWPFRQIVREFSSDGRKIDAEMILWKISAAKNRLIKPGDFSPRYEDEYELLAAEVYPKYQSALKAYNALDFDDIIMLAIDLFQSRADVLERWQKQFRYIMVDEYQDTNARSIFSSSCWLQNTVTSAWSVTTTSRSTAGGGGRGEHSRFREGLSRMQGHQARTELPFHRQYPSGGKYRYPEQREEKGKDTVDRYRGGQTHRFDRGSG